MKSSYISWWKMHFFLTCFFVTRGRWGTITLLALREAKKARFAAGALPAHDIVFARALTTNFGARMIQTSFHITFTFQCTSIKIRC